MTRWSAPPHSSPPSSGRRGRGANGRSGSRGACSLRSVPRRALNKWRGTFIKECSSKRWIYEEAGQRGRKPAGERYGETRRRDEDRRAERVGAGAEESDPRLQVS